MNLTERHQNPEQFQVRDNQGYVKGIFYSREEAIAFLECMQSVDRYAVYHFRYGELIDRQAGMAFLNQY